MALLLFLPHLFLLFINEINGKTHGYDPKKETCGVFGNFHISYCEVWHGFKAGWRKNSIAWDPEQTRNMTYDELKQPCDNVFVCKENSGCFQDFVNFQYLDECIDDMFALGPMELCEQKLREILKKTPDQLSECARKYLSDKNPEKFDCVSIKERGKCFLGDVEKYCDASFLTVYKEHQNLRLYNRACDGRLRYKDWDYAGTQDFGIHSVPGGFKVIDPKRNSTGSPNGSENFGFGFSISLIFSILALLF